MNGRPGGLSGDMSIELGKVGIWRHPSGLTPEIAAEVEALGYGAIWLGGSPDGDLGVVDQLLDATDRIVVGTSIVNVWKDDAATVAASYHRITARYPDRFVLGLGIGHPEATQEYQRPYDKLVSYLDQLDDLKVPAGGRMLAALGPRVLRLSAERSAGALPYLVTPEHTRQARQVLGTGPLLAPEQKLVLEADPGAGPGHRPAARAEPVPEPDQLPQQPAQARLDGRRLRGRRQRRADRRPGGARRRGGDRRRGHRAPGRRARITWPSRSSIPIRCPRCGRWPASFSWAAADDGHADHPQAARLTVAPEHPTVP